LSSLNTISLAVVGDNEPLVRTVLCRIAGFAIVQVKSKAEAIDLAKRFLKVAGDGESEIRQMYDAPAFAA
jgi:hypothetical protein